MTCKRRASSNNWGKAIAMLPGRRSVKVHRDPFHPILLSLCSLCALWLILRAVSKSPTTESSEGSEKHFISMAFVLGAGACEELGSATDPDRLNGAQD